MMALLLVVSVASGQNCFNREPATVVFGQLGSFTSNTVNNGGTTANSLWSPQGVAIDSASNVYIADMTHNRVLVYAAGSTTGFRVYGQQGSFTSSTLNNGGTTANSLWSPQGVAIDSASNVYIADLSNNRVLVYASGSTAAFRVFGQLGSFTSNDFNKGGISANSLMRPEGAAVDSASNVYIADQDNNRVLVYAPGSTTAFRVYGQLGSFVSRTQNNGGISANSLMRPEGVAVDSVNKVYIADSINNRILVYAPNSTTAFLVIGQLGSFTSNAANIGLISASSLSNPQGVGFDSASNLYIADESNNRVLGMRCYCSANFISATGLGPCSPCPEGKDAPFGSVTCSSCPHAPRACPDRKAALGRGCARSAT
jgi:hypothetical protein